MKLTATIRYYTLLVLAISIMASCGSPKKSRIHVSLAVGVGELVRQRCNYPDDTMVNNAIAIASQLDTVNHKSFLVLFLEAFEQKYPGVKLAPLFAAKSEGKIATNADNASVMRSLGMEEELAIKHVVSALEKRMKILGLKNSTVQMNLHQELIDVEMEGLDSPMATSQYLIKTGDLAFYEAYTNEEIIATLLQLNDTLAAPYKKGRRQDSVARSTTSDTGHLVIPHSDGNAQEAEKQKMIKENPLFALMQPFVDQRTGQAQYGPVVGIIQRADLPAVKKLLASKTAKEIMPANCRILFGEDDHKTKDVVLAYAIKMPQNGKGVITNEDITSSKSELNKLEDRHGIMMTMTAAGTVKWANMTQKCIGRFIAVTLDDVVHSCPRVMGKIPSGNTEISGYYTKEEAQALAAVLQNGKLALPVTIVKMDVVPAK